MARELLRYRPTDDLYEDWLDRIAELVSTAEEAPAPSRSLPPPPPLAGDVAHGAPPPPPRRDAVLEPRVRPLSATCRAGLRRMMKKAAKWCSGLKERSVRSQHRRIKTA